MSRILKINAKCSDLCFTEYEVDGETVIEMDGNCPDFKGIGKGDYVDMSIDLDTGKIIGYDVISHKDVMNELTDEEWDEDEWLELDENQEFDENGFNKDPFHPTVINPSILDASINDMIKDINP